MRSHIDHGFTPYYALRLIGQLDKRQSDNLEFESVTLENRIQFLKADDADFDFGAEIYNDFGKLNESSDWSEQTHTFGPVAKIKVNDVLSLETKYRAGLSKAAPDHTLGFFAKHNF